jgi:hypothetical protein
VQRLSLHLTKRFIAAGATTLLLASLLVGAALQMRRPPLDSPEKCLDQMFQTMRAGDVPNYLACFSGELREQLDATVHQQGRSSFADYLKDISAPIRGRTVFEPEYVAPGRARVKVDRVYEARMWEYQRYQLAQQAGSWTIYAIDPVQYHEPPVPYGAPAFPMDGPADTARPSAE